MLARFRLNDLSTRAQLFLAIAGSGLFLIVILLLSMRWLFIQNFTQYLAEQERTRLQQVAEVLSDYYGRQATQYDVTEAAERAQWSSILSQIQRDAWLAPETFPLDLDLSFDELNFLTNSGLLIFGPQIEDAVSQLVVFDGQVLGVLNTPVPRQAIAPIDDVYSANQHQAFLYVGGVAVILAAGIAFLFAHGLQRRLQSLRHTTEALAAGDASVRFAQHGADDVARLGRSLNKLAAVLAANENQRREFMADIAHELRTPLTVLQGELEALEDGIRQPDVIVIQRLQAQTKQLTRLVADLDTLAQADLGTLNYRWSSFDINAVISEILTGYQAAAKVQGLQMHVSIPKTPLIVFGDSERLHQVFSNVLTNSIRYTDAPGIISVRVTSQQDLIRIQVEDSAPGVAPEELPNIFNRFYRIQSQRIGQTSGSGIGLTLVERIVRAHEGSVEAVLSDLGGLCIIIQLPHPSREK